MATGRVNVGGFSIKKDTVINNYIVPGTDRTTMYEIITIPTSNINFFSSIDGNIKIEGKYSDTSGVTYRLFLNDESSSIAGDMERIEIVSFNVFKTKTNYVIKFCTSYSYGAGNRVTYQIERTLPLETVNIELKGKIEYASTGKDGRITRDYTLYSV